MQVRAFVPHTLPPAGPPVLIQGPLAESLRAAAQALVRLELAGEMVPSLDGFMYASFGSGLQVVVVEQGCQVGATLRTFEDSHGNSAVEVRLVSASELH